MWPCIEFVHGNTTAVDHRARTIDVDVAAVAGGGRKQLVYDKLVIATGASASMPAEARGAGALSFMRVEDAKALRARLGELRFSAARRKQQRLRAGKSERPAIAIVGGGYSGVELACSLAESVGKWADVKLIHRGEQVMAGADRFTRITSYQELQRRGVAISTSTSVSKIEAGALTLSSNGSATERVEDFDLLVWTAGTAGNPLIQEAQLPVTPEGRLPVDSYLRVRGESDLYCLGDVAECFDALNDRMAPNAQVAVQQSQTLAWNMHSDITGGVPVKFRYQNLGEMVTTGRFAASVSSQVFGLGASGPVGAALRRATYLLRMPNARHRSQVAASWLSRLPEELASLTSAGGKAANTKR